MSNFSRRQWLQRAGMTAAAVALGAGSEAAFAQPAAQPAQPPAGPFTLPRLPYANDALAPHIDARTMEIHHDRHHQAYVTGLNAAVAGSAELSRMTVEQLLRGIATVPMAVRQRVVNHGGGHYNHSMFWEIMAPSAGGNPTGPLAEAINTTFTNFDTFKRQFGEAATTRFGSGWAWLVYANNRLEILNTGNQDCPLMEGKVPILGLDVWEHAYYLNYQNRRPDYITAWWNVVNWPAVAMRYTRARA